MGRLDAGLPVGCVTAILVGMLADNRNEGIVPIVRFWGVRGSVPTPGPTTVRYGGNTSCVEVRLGGQVIVLDAGTGIRLLGDALASEFADESIALSLLISHTHWDHIQGLPFFSPAYSPGNRVGIFGYKGAKKGLERILSAQMESPHFPVQMNTMVGDVSFSEFGRDPFTLGEVRVSVRPLNHPGGAMGFRLEAGGVVVVYVPDNEPEPFEAHSSGREGRNQDLIEFVRDADVAIMDAQYDASEYPSHKGWGHGCVDDVVKIASAGRVRKLFLFHHDPYHDDERMDDIVVHAQSLANRLGPGMRVAAAREGLSVALPVAVAQC